MSDITTQIGREAQGLSRVNAAPRQAEVKSVENGEKKAAISIADGKELPPQSGENQAELTAAVDKLNTYVQSVQRTLDFQLDEDSGKTIIKVYDKESEELIRQIPGELAVELAQKLNEEEPLLLFSAQV